MQEFYSRVFEFKCNEESNYWGKVIWEVWYGMRKYQFSEEDGIIEVFNFEQCVEVCVE